MTHEAHPGPGLPEPGVSGISLNELISRFLTSQGVDVGRALADAGYAREHAGRRTAARADRLKDLARQLRPARRAAEFEADCWRRGSPGFTLASVTEKRTAVAELEAELREAAGWDEALIRDVKRSIAS